MPEQEPSQQITLPADSHVHSQWSWDTSAGAMAQTCARAVALGLPAVAFTEHADVTPWTLPDSVRLTLSDRYQVMVMTDGQMLPPPLDVDGYLACLEACRQRFPSVRILSGVELGEPHWWPDRFSILLRATSFDRVLASVHSVRRGGQCYLIDHLSREQDAAGLHALIEAFLEEALALAASSLPFAILTHLDYPVRHWRDGDMGPFAIERHEAGYRAVLRELARSGRALELNTRLLPAGAAIQARLLNWWRQAGGMALTIASDAHQPERLAHAFTLATDLAATAGFRPTADPAAVWVC